ncbi:2',3'-cyclic-nucleotide 3'-phosphodiesterase [Microdochium bolleyi]|uniref:2',3'-cyclic-nucleotide 3'-phosphodiesterase n=1 Tax=Microdochium bolleyi TaxID=196109 RepID=A0A136IXW8_9PEZI|nr:2',3'-cyclic-nucleotide 3'-phosphodiesterase [Microdochium bolleyi]
MPGSSLWLIPPQSHPLHGTITSLITSVLPSRFPAEAGGPDGDSPVVFAPHMTLTSEISPATYNAQAWLDSLPLPAARDVRVRLLSVDTQDVFFRRCFMRVEYEGVRDIVAVAREHGVSAASSGISEGTEEWLKSWKQAFGPHVSLIYGSTPITDDKLSQICKAVEDAGAVLSASGSTPSSEPGAGWEGGVVWLVPTDRPISEWKPIATRTL